MPAVAERDEPASRESPEGGTWSGARRRWVSLFLVFHLAAVIVAPWSAPPPASELSQYAARYFAPYLFAAHLNHGYRFFAPNPGPSHLVRYELQMPGGRRESGQFPHVDRHWPRLYYHRFLMLSESVHNLSGPLLDAPPVEQLPPAEQMEFLAAQSRAQRLLQSIANHLLHTTGAERVTLYVIQHEIPGPQDVEAGMLLTDPRLYRERKLGDFEAKK